MHSLPLLLEALSLHAQLAVTMQVPLRLLLLAGLSGLAFAKAGSKFQTLLTRSQKTSPLKLDDASFAELTDAPRDFFSMVLLTALPAQFGCDLCRGYQPEYDVLAKSWAIGDKSGETRTLFGTLDFPNGKATFQKVPLHVRPTRRLVLIRVCENR